MAETFKADEEQLNADAKLGEFKVDVTDKLKKLTDNMYDVLKRLENLGNASAKKTDKAGKKKEGKKAE